MGIQSFPFGAIVLLQSFTLGILSWTVIEQRQLRRQLQITLEELGAIRDEEIQLARELPCDPNPSPGNGPTEPSKTPDGGQWNLEVALRGLLLQLGLVILVPVSLLALVGLWCFLRKWNAASEPQLPSTPAARQQLAQRQLAEEETYIVLTPDEDMYEEELYQAEAQRMVGQGPGVVEVASSVQGAGGAPIMAVDIDTAEGFATGVLKWLAAEDGPGVQYGQEVQGVSIPTVRGCKHVHQGADGKQLFVECVDGADYEVFMRRPATRDIRILPVHYNALGQPERSLKEVAAECSEAKVRWTLSGPRAARWCVNYLAIENLGFEGHHERLRQVTKADASSWGIQEHFQVSMALRQALLVDQLDAYNLLTIEVQFRRLQTIEFSYSEKAKEMEAKAVGGRLSLEEQTTFGGVVRQYSTLMVCPDLLSFVKEETEKEASLAKILRKAREVVTTPAPLGLFSRGSKQRIGRRQHFEAEVKRTVSSLNAMYGKPGKLNAQAQKGAKMSQGQAKVLEFVEHAVRRVGAPAGLTGSEALEELRVSEGYEALPTSSPLGSFDPELIALPAIGGQPVPLASLWGEDGQREVEDFIRTQTLGAAEAEEKKRSIGLTKTYEDPQFKDHNKYAGFVKRLYDLSLVDVSLAKPQEAVSIFFVKKKAGKLRMILDCRLANTHFAEPEGIRLASADSITKMEVPGQAPLYTASADLQNAFYTMGMPMGLRQLFGLKKVRASELGISEVAGVPVRPEQWVYPRVAVIPMGWSHAMWWCQRLSEKLVEGSGLLKEERVRDFDPVPAGNFWHIEYVDNLVVFGTNKAEVERRFWLAVTALREAGLTVHEIEFGTGECKVLGWAISEQGVVSPTSSRLWRLRLGIREILKRGRASGQQLERLVGHMTFVSLCRREALSALGDIYTFIRRHYSTVVPLWKSVRRELSCWDGVSPLIFVNLGTPWNDTLYSVDASEWGMGVTTSKMDQQAIATLGRHVERWRFRDPLAKNPRLYVHEADYVVGAVESPIDEEAGGVTATSQPELPKSRPAEAPLTWDIELSNDPGPMKQKQRAARRRQAKLDNPGKTLRRSSVSSKTLKTYDKIWKEFQQWSQGRVHSQTSFQDLDSLLTAYLEHIYEQGEDLSKANYVTAAVIFNRPGSKGLAAMPMAQQSMKGWRKLCPPRSRMPIPFEATCLLVQRAVECGRKEVGLVVILIFLLYLRPSEPFRLRVQDIVRPIRKAAGPYKKYAILLHPTEMGIPSKTQQWDEMLSLDLEVHRFLGPALVEVLQLRTRNKQEAAFKVKMAEVISFLENAWKKEGFTPMGEPHLYRLRHGGASYESANRLRDLTAIQARGRWQTLKSVKNYEKGGRLQQLFGSLDEVVQRRCLEAAARLPKLFQCRR
ncbi:hypothetical protein AK812_SmicGene5815 [Symbiodinium microadriaticum]|uniref:Reverse transcriptase domain-containing protein n=1 Tax=Symbiodinium microadriaticum TaxID=2951 RepID=A0A1Q9ESW8_SYMMI|nr:hypothetical protein AK812_SmicGene5815 [Symbiodinium microadriaticum]